MIKKAKSPGASTSNPAPKKLQKSHKLVIVLISTTVGLAIIAGGLYLATATDKSTNSTQPSPGSSAAADFCAIFADIEKQTSDPDAALDSAEDWQERINWTQRLVAVAPERLREQGSIYLQIVKDRAELMAKYDYVSVQGLPRDISTQFIADHKDAQLRANELIDYATTNCGAAT